MRTSRRLWIAVCAALLAAGLIAFAWRAWPEVLMFGGIVAVAAWGFGRHTRVKSHSKAAEAAVADDTPAVEREHIA
jgi:hypothetical protein